MDPSGLVHVGNVMLASPRLHVASGGGTYSRQGALDLRFNGISDDYGRLSVHVTGSASAPQVALEAANPGFGIGLANVVANVRAVAGGWAIQARGDSSYGPFTADVVVQSGTRADGDRGQSPALRRHRVPRPGRADRRPDRSRAPWPWPARA